MKKLLLSSIIMFGISGYVTAQKTTEAKIKKAETVTVTNSFTNATDAQKPVAAPANKTKADIAATEAAAKPAAGKNATPKVDETKAVNEAGEVVTDDVAAKKAAAAKAAAAKKNKDN